MALKRNITKEQFENLADNIKFEYKQGDDENVFVLQTEGDEDVGALKRANARLKDQKEQMENRNDELVQQLEAIEKNPARKSGDIAALERQWKAESAETEGKLTGTIDKLKAKLLDGAASQAALALAEKISTAPKLMLPHVKSRIAAELDDDGNVLVKVIGADGKPSDLTVDKLGEEMVANTDYSGIIRATKASGGAGASNRGDAVNPPGNNGGNDGKTLADMTPQELAARFG